MEGVCGFFWDDALIAKTLERLLEGLTFFKKGVMRCNRLAQQFGGLTELEYPGDRSLRK